MSPTKDAVELYQGALQGVDKAKLLVEHMVANIRDAARKLESWKELEVAATQGAAGNSLSMPMGRTIEWNNLPAGRELERALAEWHRACRDAHSAWKGIPTPRQIGLVAPGDFCQTAGNRLS